MPLNFTIQGEGKPILLIHGLFGDAKNLGGLARTLQHTHKVISVDLCNHGRSFHSDKVSHQLMAQDLISLLDQNRITQCDVIGHSLGGKVAMCLSSMAPSTVDRLIVLDIAPIAYSEHRHQNVFLGLQAILDNPPSSRQQADVLLSQSIEETSVRQFLMKSLIKTADYFEWSFNAKGLMKNYDQLMGWQENAPFYGQTLFIKGGNSDYLLPEHQSAITRQFPNAKAHIVAQTGHWLHAEKPEIVGRIINRFLGVAESNDNPQSVL